MKESVVRKLEHLVERFEEVQALLGDPGVIGDQDKFRNLSKEFSQLEDVVAGFNAYQQAQENLASAQEMLNEDDAEMREMAQEEMKDAKAEIERLETELQVLLCQKILTMITTVSWKFAQVQVVTKRQYLQVTCSACTAVMPKVVAGV